MDVVAGFHLAVGVGLREPALNSSQITRRSRSSFSLAFFGLSRAQRRALEALYAYCRIVDDLADGVSGVFDAAAELARWREVLCRLDSLRPGDHAIAFELAEAAKKFSLRRDDLLWVLSGVEADLSVSSYETIEDLLPYCDSVASSVGFSVMAILGADRQRTTPYVLATGRALQLTNILRDVSVDFDMGRIYLPCGDLERFNYTKVDLSARKYDKSFVELMRFQAGRAWEFFKTAEVSLPGEDRSKLAAAECMRRTYQALLTEMEARNFDVFRGRITISKLRKAAVAFRSHWSCRSGVRSWCGT